MTGPHGMQDMRAAISKFVQKNADYYLATFGRIQSATKSVFPFHTTAFLVGSLWASARGLWGVFWTFALLELFALVQIGRGLWGDLGADLAAEAEAIRAKAAQFLEQAEQARQAGDQNADSLAQSAENLLRAADERLVQAEQVSASHTNVLLAGLILLLALRLAIGFLANVFCEHRFSQWRIRQDVVSGFSWGRVLLGMLTLGMLYPLTLYRFTASVPAEWIKTVPTNSEIFVWCAIALDRMIDWSAQIGKGVFDGITATVRFFLLGFEYVMLTVPWPVIFVFVALIAWRVAGFRVAIVCVAGLAYLGLFGFWETSMITLALTSTATLLCVIFGIPLGIWFANNARAYAYARPVLDLMQTLPPFVYLIPIIAFFGTGRVPGVLATMIVAMPPLIRLTALGLVNVDKNVLEAARSFGAGKRELLLNVELPLARASIMTGINQTIMLSLGMVVIASLIGAKGLGQEVLIALQRLDKGDGMLAGLAILVCAVILDRIAQGRAVRSPVK